MAKKSQTQNAAGSNLGPDQEAQVSAPPPAELGAEPDAEFQEGDTVQFKDEPKYPCRILTPEFVMTHRGRDGVTVWEVSAEEAKDGGVVINMTPSEAKNFRDHGIALVGADDEANEAINAA